MSASWWQKLCHAFSLERYDEPLTEEERRLLDKIAVEVVRRRMQVPAIFILESAKPLNYLGSQAMAFFEPVVRTLSLSSDYGQVRRILERRQSIECLLEKIEEQTAGEAMKTSDKVEGASG